MNKHLVSAIGLALLTFPAFGQGARADANNQTTAQYDPLISPAEFGPIITNKYYTLNPGMKADYEQITSRGLKHIQIDVTGDTKQVLGVTTLVVRHRDWLNGRLLEDTRGWVAQDKRGNVWYFGEAVESYENSKLVNRDGSWEAGLDGAKPGILMLSEPKPGATYRREYHPGKAEDMGTVVAAGISVRISRGPLFQNCVHIREWSPLKKKEFENKYYCVGIGGMVLKEERADRFKLVSFKKGNDSSEEQSWRTALVR